MRRLIVGFAVGTLFAVAGCEEAPKQVSQTTPALSSKVNFECNRHKDGSDLQRECHRNELIALEAKLNQLAPSGNVPEGYFQPPSQGRTSPGDTFWESYFQYIVLRDLLTPRVALSPGWVSQQPLVPPPHYTKVVVVDGRRYTPEIDRRVREYSQAVKRGDRPATYAGKVLPATRQQYVGAQQPRVRPSVGQSVGGRATSIQGKLQPTRPSSAAQPVAPALAPRVNTPAPAPRVYTPAPAPRVYTPAPAPRVYTPAPTVRVTPSFSGGFSRGR